MLAAECGQRTLWNLDDVHAVEEHLSFGRAVQCRQDIEQRRLSRTALSHDCDIFALLHCKAHILQRRDLAAAETGRIYFFQMADF